MDVGYAAGAIVGDALEPDQPDMVEDPAQVLGGDIPKGGPQQLRDRRQIEGREGQVVPRSPPVGHADQEGAHGVPGIAQLAIGVRRRRLAAVGRQQCLARGAECLVTGVAQPPVARLVPPQGQGQDHARGLLFQGEVEGVVPRRGIGDRPIVKGRQIDQLEQVPHPVELLGARERGGRRVEGHGLGRQAPGIVNPAGGQIAGDDETGEGGTGGGQGERLLDQGLEDLAPRPPLPAVETTSEGLAIAGEHGDELPTALGAEPASFKPLPLGIGLDPGLDEAIEERRAAGDGVALLFEDDLTAAVPPLHLPGARPIARRGRAAGTGAGTGAEQQRREQQEREKPAGPGQGIGSHGNSL